MVPHAGDRATAGTLGLVRDEPAFIHFFADREGRTGADGACAKVAAGLERSRRTGRRHASGEHDRADRRVSPLRRRRRRAARKKRDWPRRHGASSAIVRGGPGRDAPHRRGKENGRSPPRLQTTTFRQRVSRGMPFEYRITRSADACLGSTRCRCREAQREGAGRRSSRRSLPRTAPRDADRREGPL